MNIYKLKLLLDLETYHKNVYYAEDVPFKKILLNKNHSVPCLESNILNYFKTGLSQDFLLEILYK